MVSKSQQKATDKYNLKAYDRVCIRVKKGAAETWQAAAAKAGKSMTQLITDAVEEYIDRECLR